MNISKMTFKWFGQAVNFYDGNLKDIDKYLPLFERHPFGNNDYLKVIVRNPIGNDFRSIPVATVSKSYILIQHEEIYKYISDAFNSSGFNLNTLESQLILSEYGERMHLKVNIPGFDIDPGDGFPINLMISIINSVDKSCALEINFLWIRYICSNGMFLSDEKKLRKIHHIKWLSKQNIEEYFRKQLTNALNERSIFLKWFAINVTQAQLSGWVDNFLTKEWGTKRANRVMNISMTGYDSDTEVPGISTPVSNAFHLSQVLSWIATRERNIEGQFYKMKDIPRLINSIQ
jgi:hypothetical protein